MILHDYIEQTDGGSRLCLDLARYLDIPLLCGFVRSHHPFLQEAGIARPTTLMPCITVPLLRQWLLALAFRHARRLPKHGPLLFSGSYAPLAVHNASPNAHTVLYCHTPPRFLYDQRETFVQMLPPPARPALRAFCQWLRPRYEAAVGRMTAIVVNSQAVRQRVAHWLGRTALVISPPCKTEFYAWQPSQGYYLSMVRLDALKRVDTSIRAFMRMPHLRLVILSDGPQASALQRLAANATNIHFAGTVSEQERLRLLAHCTATLCTAKEEDFGMCAVESLAAGKPVIAASAGGLAEICASPAYSFSLPPDPTPDDVCAALTRCDVPTAAAMRHDCRCRAEEFSLPRFGEAMRRVLYHEDAHHDST